MSGCKLSVAPSKKQIVIVALVVGLFCLLVYLRALTCEFINWDDQDYILNNTAIRSLDGIVKWAFTTNYLGWWMPITWISFAIDYHLWGLNPVGYHLTNIFLHAVNSGLVVLIADALLKQWSKVQAPHRGELQYLVTLLLAGLLFGIHPLRVESVAWVTERKDVLNGMFALGSLFFYFRYVRKRENTEIKQAVATEYIMSLLFFMLSLMTKPVSVVIPMMLLLADWYPYNRLQKGNLRPVLLEKIPFVMLSVMMSCLIIWLSSQDHSLLEGITFWQRAIISGNAIFEYCYLLLFPIGILPLYVIPSDFVQSYTIKTAVVIAFTIFAVVMLRKKPCIIVIWLSFVIPLLPTLAFTQNGMQAYAARFTYLPSIVISIVVANVITSTYARIAGRCQYWLKFPMCVLIVSLVIFYVAMTQRLITVWKDSGTYWSRVITLQPFDAAFYYRGLFYLDTGNYLAAIDDFTICLTEGIRTQRSDIFNVYAFRGQALIKAGRYNEAVRDLTAALKMSPQPIYFYFRGTALISLGKLKQAKEDFEKAGM